MSDDPSPESKFSLLEDALNAAASEEKGTEEKGSDLQSSFSDFVDVPNDGPSSSSAVVDPEREDCPDSEKEDTFSSVPVVNSSSSSSSTTAVSSAAAPSSTAFVMGNASRKNGAKSRDTQFYQVLNVSETWHRNHTLSKKDDAKIVYATELLKERLDGYGYVAVEIFDNMDVRSLGDSRRSTNQAVVLPSSGSGKFRIRMKDSGKVLELREKICEALNLKDAKSIDLIHDGKPISDSLNVAEALKEAKMSWPKPYIGLVWVCPR